jgi:hypothetical protein
MRGNKKGVPISTPSFFFASRILLGLNSLRRTSVSASTAIYAEVGIDNILGIAFRDSLRGTLVNASTALDTVVSDYVSHSSNI